MFCSLMQLNRRYYNDEDRAKMMADTRVHLEFVASLYVAQHDAGLLWLHEHPDRATSWQEECMLELLAKEGVKRVTSDMCVFGMTVLQMDEESGEKSEQLAVKPTGWATSTDEIDKALNKRCDHAGRTAWQQHRHARLFKRLGQEV